MQIEASHQIEVRVPQLSESVSEATLLSWHKQEGEAVAEGESLIDIETDKVVLELPAIKAGVLTKILKQNGEKVTSNEVIAILGIRGQRTEDGGQKKPAAAVKAQAAVMPAARKIAADQGVDVGAISGSGRDGRVLKEDVLVAMQEAKPTPSPPAGEGWGEGGGLLAASNSACR